MKRVLCFGNINFDIVFDTPRLPREHEKLSCPVTALSGGGAASNTAFWLARFGVATTLLGCVGADALGEAALAELAGEGVDTSRVARAPEHPTGVAVILASGGSKRMLRAAGANALAGRCELPQDLLSAGVHLHAAHSDVEQVSRLLRVARERGATTSCELGSAPARSLIPLSDLCFINSDELARAFGADPSAAAWRALAAGSRSALAVTLGSAGARFVGPELEETVPAPSVQVADRTGGGDAFDAGFLRGFLAGASAAKSLALGLGLAGEVISRPGARPTGISTDALLGQSGLDR